MQNIPVPKRYQPMLIIILPIIGVALFLWPRVSTIQSENSYHQQSTINGIDGPDIFSEQSLIQPTPTPVPTTVPMVIVYISGAVHMPDTYQLPATARVKDLVVAAGGLTKEADPDHINLAAHIVDADHVYVPHQGEVTNTYSNESTLKEQSESSSTNSLINLNTANTTELETINGVGKTTAQRIVEYRTNNGPFESVENLQDVDGIGPSKFKQIEPFVTIEP
ncbi:MAG: ComEA family DNA-binding protein [Chloroflexota bacterium]